MSKPLVPNPIVVIPDPKPIVSLYRLVANKNVADYCQSDKDAAYTAAADNFNSDQGDIDKKVKRDTKIAMTGYLIAKRQCGVLTSFGVVLTGEWLGWCIEGMADQFPNDTYFGCVDKAQKEYDDDIKRILENAQLSTAQANYKRLKAEEEADNAYQKCLDSLPNFG